MANARGSLGVSAVLVTVLATGSVAHAARPVRPDRAAGPADSVPEALRPWAGWVLHGDGDEQLACPQLHGHDDDRVCAWPARLSLTVNDKGGTFAQEWEVFHAGLAELPGSDEHWPLDVRVDGKPAAVVSGDDGDPVLELAAGHHLVTGRFAWDEALPDGLAVPPETGLLALTVNGRRVDFPVRDEGGQVFLGRKEVVAEADSIDISVHRKLVDDVPLHLITRLQLAVSGKSREVMLGRALPEGFQAQEVVGNLPLRFDADGHVRLQVRPGSWTITLIARRTAAGDSVTRPRPDGLWKEGEEVWVFQSRPELRVVDLGGAPAIDPAQTTLPDDWKLLPAYALPPGATLTLAERRRGDSDAGPDQLQLQRRLWLDFDGGGYTVSDQITGRFTRSWRLAGAAHTRLGRVAINGRDQFITRDADGNDGVEIRSGRAAISADSRIEGRRWRVPATSFLLDFQSVSTTLMIPPGWRLIHAAGADKVTGTWIDRWSLLSFFLLLVTTLAAQRLFGWKLALVALVGIGLSITESDAPGVVWLAVLLGEALARALRTGKLHTLARVYRIAAWIALASVLFPYAVAEVRRGVHPAAEREGPTTERSQVAFFVPEAPAPVPAEAPVATAEGHASAMGALGDLSKEASGSGIGLLARPKKDVEQPRGSAYAGKAGLLGVDKNLRLSDAVSQKRDVYDPSAVVQTGPGLPTWEWDTASLTFNAPVRQDQELQLWLAPPSVNLALSLARAALLVALALLILRRPMRLGGGWHAARPLLDGAGNRAGILLLLLATTAAATLSGVARAAELTAPSPELLEQLKQRLLEPPHCAPNCGGISRLALDVTPGELQLVLEASAAARTAIPLPGNLKDWVPDQVRVDGKVASALARTDDGTLWLALSPGTFRVEMTGALSPRETIQIALPLKPRFVTARVRGWTLDGLHEDGAADESLKLSRAGGATGTPAPPDAAGAAVSLAPFLRVTRTLHLGLKWEVETVVRRETPTGAPVVIDVPLLPGEAVTTAGVRVDKAKTAVNVSLGPDATETQWRSTLTESAALRLHAAPAFARLWAETWLLDLGATWHATFAGIPPIQRADPDGARIAEWRPWPGEEVRIALGRPAGAGGQTLTIDGGELDVSPGTRMTRSTLSLAIRSSRGTQHTIALAAGAELEGVTLDGQAMPLHLESDGRRIVLPIGPRKQTFAISWREPTPLSPIFRAPAVDVGVPATNIVTQIQLAEAPRWMLWAAGPRLGPAVHIWSIVIVLLVMGWVLGRTRLTPLRWWDWTLLGIGMAQLPLPAAGVVGLFLLAMGWRARHPIAGRAVLYDLSQIVFVGLTVAAVAILFGAIEQGLVSHPDMRVVGNGSNDQLLRWYQDRTGPLLPRPWILSAPLMMYRGAMLAWSLWLALACLRWSRWVWSCLREHGWWRPLRVPRAAPDATPEG